MIKIIFALLLILYMPISNAGVLSKITMEIFEATGKTLKNTDPDALVPATKQLTKVTLRTIDIKQTVEGQITDFINIENDICNSNDYDGYVKFYKTYSYPKSLEMNEALSDNTLYFFKNYKYTCNLKNVEFIGHGASINIDNNYAYAVVHQSGAIPGIVSAVSKSMYIFKLDGETWKLWDTITFSETFNAVSENWWFYDRNKEECNILKETSNYYPINIINHDNMVLECSSKGFNENTLIIKCNKNENTASQIYIYSTKKSTCEIYSKI